MKTIDLRAGAVALEEVIEIARREPVLLLAPDGTEFFLSEADDFDKEVEALRSSPAFHRFLDRRSAATSTISIDDLEREMERELPGKS